MKCVICKSSDIALKQVDEEIREGSDIVLVPIDVMVCRNCGERYYDSNNMKKIEETRDRLRRNDLEVKEVGKVFRSCAA